MVVVVNHLHLSKPIAELREPFEKEASAILASLPGFHAASLTQEAVDRGTVIILWEDRPAADNGGKVLGPGWFHTNVAPYLASEQQRTVGDVIARA